MAMSSASMVQSMSQISKASTGSAPAYHLQHHHQHPRSFASPPSSTSPNRIHTLDLKAKLASALGGQGKRYWDALLRFCTAKIARTEFESEARGCLKPEDVHLHNSLVLGILYNASSAVPGPSASRKGWRVPGTFSASHPDHKSSIRQDEVDAYQHEHSEFDGETLDPEAATASMEPDKRLCVLAASLSSCERQRIKAMSKPLARNLSSTANTSSWAGAGADLLERKRKEEEKKSKESERKRLKEQHTEIGSKDWMKEVLAEDSIRQENKASLPAATAQALMRGSKIPLCIDSKTLPQVDSLADLMTAHAVEAGLTGGVSTDAADMLSAGLQAHIRNVVSGMIMAVRANRAAGGIRTSAPLVHERGNSGYASIGDDHSASSLYESPTETASRLELPDLRSYDQAYSKIISVAPNRPSKQSSRVSTGSSSNSTPASSIFTNANARRYNAHIGSGPDSSVISLVSTAATTQAGSGSEVSSDVEVDFDKEAIKAQVKGTTDSSDDSLPTEDFDEYVNVKDEGEVTFALKRPPAVADDRGIVMKESYIPAVLPHRPLFRTSRPTAELQSPRSTLSLRDLAFFLRLEPHVLVEPAGLGAMEKLLAPDADEKSASLHQLAWSEGGELGEEERLAVAARHSAYLKEGAGEEVDEDGELSSVHHRHIAPLPTLRASRSASASSGALPGRKSYLVKQQAPLSLLLHRDIVSNKRKQQSVDKEDADLGANTATGPCKRGYHHVDPLSEVVDPVRLLAGYCS